MGEHKSPYLLTYLLTHGNRYAPAWAMLVMMKNDLYCVEWDVKPY